MIARRTSVWSREWQVSADGASYSIARANMFTLKLEVLLEGGAALGAVTGGSFWGNRPVLEIDSSVPVAHAVFLLWMAFLIRARAG